MNRILPVLALVAFAGPALAQDKPTPASELYDTCLAFVTGSASAIADATAAGWSFEEADQMATPIQVNAYARRTIEGVGDASLVAVTETYPASAVHFCRVDIFQPTGDIGIEPLDKRDGVVGTLVTQDDGLYGSWEDDAASGKLLIQAQRGTTDYIQLSIYETKAAQ